MDMEHRNPDSQTDAHDSREDAKVREPLSPAEESFEALPAEDTSDFGAGPAVDEESSVFEEETPGTDTDTDMEETGRRKTKPEDTGSLSDEEDLFIPEENVSSPKRSGGSAQKSVRNNRSGRPSQGKKRKKSGRDCGTGSRRSSSRSRGKGRKGRRARADMLHLLLSGIIALMVIFAVVRLIVWNIGKDSGYDPNADSSEYETEALDYIQPLDPQLLEGREDDGVTTIVCLGNAPFSDDRGPDGLAELIASGCNATVYNCAFPDSCVSMKYQNYQDSYPMDALSLYLVTASLCGGDYTLMEHAVSQLQDRSDAAREALDTLKSVDFSRVDMLVMMYDLNDYRDGRSLVDPNNDINLLTWAGALNASIQQIQQAYPYIRIVLLSPPYGSFTDENGETINGDTKDFGNGVLPDYVQYEVDTAMANGVSILDNYYGTITESDASLYLEDGHRLNRAGRERIAARFAKAIFGLHPDGAGTRQQSQTD